MDLQNKKQASKPASKQPRMANEKKTKGEAQANAKISKLTKRCATLERLTKRYKSRIEKNESDSSRKY